MRAPIKTVLWKTVRVLGGAIHVQRGCKTQCIVMPDSSEAERLLSLLNKYERKITRLQKENVNLSETLYRS